MIKTFWGLCNAVYARLPRSIQEGARRSHGMPKTRVSGYLCLAWSTEQTLLPSSDQYGQLMRRPSKAFAAPKATPMTSALLRIKTARNPQVQTNLYIATPCHPAATRDLLREQPLGPLLWMARLATQVGSRTTVLWLSRPRLTPPYRPSPQGSSFRCAATGNPPMIAISHAPKTQTSSVA